MPRPDARFKVRALAAATLLMLIALVAILQSTGGGDPADRGFVSTDGIAMGTPAASVSSKASSPKYEPDEILVSFESETSEVDRARLRHELDFGLKRKIGDDIQQLTLPKGVSPSEAQKQLEKLDAVAIAEPNYLTQSSATPNDPSFDQQWGLHNTGQVVGGNPGTADADIDAPEAWNTSTGSSAVTIAVIDSGVDLDHPDLVGSIWTNPGETGSGKDTNGLDDDGNGKIDDWRGWDFINNDSVPDDDNGHGSHVAGIAAATGNNATGVSGVSQSAKIMALKTQGSSGMGNMGNMMFAIDYAAAKGAKILSISVVGPLSRLMKEVIDSHPELLVVAGAGNNGVDTGTAGFAPCATPSANVICVGASDQNDGLASFSNYSATNVDLAAPGTFILSTLPGGGYGLNGGTSMATPFVSGAAAVLASYRPTASARKLKSALLDGVDKKPAFAGKFVSNGRLNLANSLSSLSGTTSKASVVGNKVVFNAAQGKTNALTITTGSGRFTLTDTSGVTASTGCTQSTSTRVTCPTTGITSLAIDLGDLNDTFTNSTSTPANVDGSAGNDTITGGTGSDTLEGGTGTDVFNGGSGTDTVDYGGVNQSVTVTIDGTANDGPAGENDNVKTDVENVTGGAGADTITGSSSANVIDGGAGTNTLFGSGGNDTLSGGTKSDDFNGGSGTDTVSYAGYDVKVYVTPDNSADDGAHGIGSDSYSVNDYDNVRSDIENVIGGNAGDVLAGTAGANRIDGGPGDDQITADLGADVYVGGTGTDTISYETRTVPVTVKLDGSANDGQSSETDNVGADVENVRTGSGNDLINGSSANNTLDGGTGSDTITGSSGTDTIDYSSRTDSVSVSLDGVANDGNSSVGEVDNVAADFENISTGAGNDTVIGNSSANTITTRDGADALSGAAGNDTLTAGAGTDSLNGGANDDLLDGGDGTDTFATGGGSDTVTYASTFVDVSASLDGSANDGAAGESENIPVDVSTLIGGYGNDTLTGSSQADTLNGGPGNDVITGLGGADILEGDGRFEPTGLVGVCGADGQGADTLSGGDGNDRLTGGGGADTLSGGNDNDTLREGLLGAPSCPDGEADGQADDVHGDDGIDTIDYTGSAQPIAAILDDAANDGLVFAAADNFHTDIENVNGTNTGDVIIGSELNNVLDGKSGIPTNGDLILGNGGDDTIRNSNPGHDIFEGGNGVDTFDFSAFSSAVTVDLGAAGDQNTGAGGNDSFAGIENLIGTPGADTFTGTSADNRFDGGAGADVFNGLGGIDTVTYNNAARTAGVTADLDGVADDGNASDGSTTKDNIKTDIENITGTSFADTLTGNAFANALVGLAGVDTMSGLDGDDSFDAKDGLNDNTTICGAGNDTVLADVLPFDPVDASCEPAGVSRP